MVVCCLLVGSIGELVSELDDGYGILEGNDGELYTSCAGQGFTCLPKVHQLCHTFVAELVLSQGIIAV